MSIRPDDPRLADFTPEEIARGVPEQVREKTPAEILAEQNAARLGEVAGAADVAGSFVTGEEQARVDEILAGVQSGIYSAADALGALSAIEAAGRAALASAGGGGGGGGGASFTPRQDARNTIRAVLTTFGLEGLADVVYEEYAAERVNISNPDAVLFSIRNTAQYQQRFAANAKRAAKGLPELDPASYIALENQYRDLMRANGLPPGFYDQISDFEKLIEGDVSVYELSSRVTEGYRKVAEADPAVKQQMRQLYNVDESGLAAYFLDPDRAAPLLLRQANAAAIAARGREQANLQLSAMSAEELVSRGITGEQAQSTFARMGQLAGLYQEMGGEEMLTEQQKVGAAFGFDVQAQQALERRRAQRVAEFEAGGQFARTTGATSGTIETGVGLAQ